MKSGTTTAAIILILLIIIQMHFFIVKLIPDVDILNSIKTLNIIYIKQTNRPNTIVTVFYQFIFSTFFKYDIFMVGLLFKLS